MTIQVAGRGQEDTDYRLCSLNAFDTTATMETFHCELVRSTDVNSLSNLPIVTMDLISWIIQDKTTILRPRTPLAGTRTVCENYLSEKNIGVMYCAVSYGAELTVTDSFSWSVGAKIGAELDPGWDQNWSRLAQVQNGNEQS